MPCEFIYFPQDCHFIENTYNKKSGPSDIFDLITHFGSPVTH